MRKWILSLAAFGVMLSANVKAANAGSNKDATVVEDTKWMKDPDGAWEGKKSGKTYWYKLDKNFKLWFSSDAKKWEAVGDDMWIDKSNHWLKVKDKKLVWSGDSGKTWSEVPESKWEGSDGKWYKFDKDWTLWVAA
jgi:hypothetical protein